MWRVSIVCDWEMRLLNGGPEEEDGEGQRDGEEDEVGEESDDRPAEEGCVGGGFRLGTGLDIAG